MKAIRFWLAFFIVVVYSQCACGLTRKCNCSCTGLDNALELNPELKAKVQKMVSELKVDSKNTSSHTRSLTSANDERTSAQATGAVGVALLGIVFGLMVSCDLSRFFGSAKEMIGGEQPQE